MRSVAVIFLVLGCLLNQVARQALLLDGDGNSARIAAAQPTATDVLLRGSDAARLPHLVESLPVANVLPQVVAPSARALEQMQVRGEDSRPTLQSLDVRLQV